MKNKLLTAIIILTLITAGVIYFLSQKTGSTRDVQSSKVLSDTMSDNKQTEGALGLTKEE
jgi:uncharacterized protein (UPF0333 family)